MTGAGMRKSALVDGYVDLAISKGFIAQTFWTLTFDERRLGRVSAERALDCWHWFVGVVNSRMHGDRFRRWCKHSAFSYIVAVDYSWLGAVHLHAVVDGWVDFKIGYAIWNSSFGAPRAKMIDGDEDVRVAIGHVFKYAMSGSDRIEFWFRDRAPHRKPPSGKNSGACPAGACQGNEQGMLPGFSAQPPAVLGQRKHLPLTGGGAR